MDLEANAFIDSPGFGSAAETRRSTSASRWLLAKSQEGGSFALHRQRRRKVCLVVCDRLSEFSALPPETVLSIELGSRAPKSAIEILEETHRKFTIYANALFFVIDFGARLNGIGH